MPKRKRTSQATKGLRPKRIITGAQRKARRINIRIAREYRKSGKGNVAWLKGQKGKPLVKHPEVDKFIF